MLQDFASLIYKVPSLVWLVGLPGCWFLWSLYVNQNKLLYHPVSESIYDHLYDLYFLHTATLFVLRVPTSGGAWHAVQIS